MAELFTATVFTKQFIFKHGGGLDRRSAIEPLNCDQKVAL
jgi:hypothetical protein